MFRPIFAGIRISQPRRYKMNDSQILNNMVYTFQITDIDFIALCNILFLDDLKRNHTPIIFRSVVLSSYRRAPASRVMILSLTRRNNIVDISSYHFILTIIHDSSHPIFRYKFKSILQRRRRLESNQYFCRLNITHSCRSIFFQKDLSFTTNGNVSNHNPIYFQRSFCIDDQS